jgi:N-acetylneuraminate lyase
MQPQKTKGLIAATFTPMDARGEVDLSQVPTIGQYVMNNGVNGIFVAGSTGEGESLSSEERRAIAKAYVDTCIDSIPVIIQVGHNSIREAQGQAAHAQDIGATAIAAASPSYFRPKTAADLFTYLSELASAAPNLPLYYYHIPGLNQVNLDMVELLRLASNSLPSFAGLKYSAVDPCEMRSCIDFDEGRYEIMFGSDEMLLYGLYSGALAAVGSTYNFMAPLYQGILKAFDDGDVHTAAELQSHAVRIIEVILRYPLIPALKATMGFRGLSVGPCRTPNCTLSSGEREDLRTALDQLGFFKHERKAAN